MPPSGWIDTLFDPDPTAPSVVLSYGLGVDSTAILLRWLHEPACRDFDLNHLVVVTAMTGDEWAQTGRDVEAHVLPTMREHGVRYVQLARQARRANLGVVVLDDSTQPTQLHLDGAYKLSQEMLDNGTVPQVGGSRQCSMHAKGEVIDPIVAGLTAAKPYRHILGFEAEERKRADKDAGFNTALRTAEYPLIEWGWDRHKCEEYIFGLTGVHWQKSACTYCPFALSSIEGRRAVVERFASDPDAADLPLFMEHVALAINPTQSLTPKLSLRALLATKPGLEGALERFDVRLNHEHHALYEVRRISQPKARSVIRRAEGSRAEMLALLATYGPVEVEGGVGRVYLRRRADTLSTADHYYVAAPAVVIDKQRSNFDAWWAKATQVA